ncbi:hypothetical protein [Bacillus atrophaeus]|uniref:hypothetical protein n=1 Tax=Bacillus atrophaeus TaxID=1452 RepID=UPI001CB9B88B|nr:hypothetical protein [Bacillus atrophaeus]WNV81640.1 hypothetical protein RUL31_10480 [Bacillus atrophaeus]
MEIEIRNAIEIDNKQYSLSDNKMDPFKKVIEELANTILKTHKLEKIVFTESYEEDLFAVLKEKGKPLRYTNDSIGKGRAMMVEYLGAENIQKATIVYHSEILREMISNIRAKDKAKDEDNPENNRGLNVFFHELAHVNDPVNFSVNDFNAKGTDLAIVPLALMVWKEYFANRVANEMYPTIPIVVNGLVGIQHKIKKDMPALLDAYDDLTSLFYAVIELVRSLSYYMSSLIGTMEGIKKGATYSIDENIIIFNLEKVYLRMKTVLNEMYLTIEQGLETQDFNDLRNVIYDLFDTVGLQLVRNNGDRLEARVLDHFS